VRGSDGYVDDTNDADEASKSHNEAAAAAATAAAAAAKDVMMIAMQQGICQSNHGDGLAFACSKQASCVMLPPTYFPL